MQLPISCPVEPLSLLQPFSPAKIHYLLTGSFNTIFLYLLAFNPTERSLSIHEKITGEGPHQFLALNPARDRLYATTWGSPASLSAWEVFGGGKNGIQKINTVPITATSSYLHVSPDYPCIYSAGGPTGEVHAINPETGGFGKKLQEMTYMSRKELETADKTRIALRYGSHGIDLSIKKQAFVPHLGLNAIVVYDVNPDGTLKLRGTQKSFGDGEPDGPRHNVPSPDGKTLYVVTEHSSYIDVYTINLNSLSHRQRLSIIPPEKSVDRLSYRGDTLRLSQNGHYLYTTTRGKTASTKGYVTVWFVNPDGSLGISSSSDTTSQDPSPPLVRYETATSGGKANAVEAFPFHTSEEGGGFRDWIVLTDDEAGWVWMLEWDGAEMKEVSSVMLGGGEEGLVTASHAVWLS